MSVFKTGMELDEGEQLIWAKANTRSEGPLSEDDWQAIITEHTEPIGKSTERRKIPAIDFERASEMLGWLAGRCREILDSTTLPPDHYSAVQAETLNKGASDLRNAITDNIRTD
jgi:hypothetical protein